MWKQKYFKTLSKSFQKPLQVCFIPFYQMLPGCERSVLFPVGLLTQVTGTVKKTEERIIFSQGEKLKRYVCVLYGAYVSFPKFVRERLYFQILGVLESRQSRDTCLKRELLFVVSSSFAFLSVSIICLNTDMPVRSSWMLSRNSHRKDRFGGEKFTDRKLPDLRKNRR